MKCNKCKKVAIYDSPKAYCAYHWAKWWTQGWDKTMSKAQFKKAFAEVLEIAQR